MEHTGNPLFLLENVLDLVFFQILLFLIREAPTIEFPNTSVSMYLGQTVPITFTVW